MRRYDGLNGQIVIDGPYLWLTREHVPAPLDVRLPLEPRRVLLEKVVGCLFEAGEPAGVGSVCVLVEDAATIDAYSTDEHPDAIVFAPDSREEFRRLAALLSGAGNESTSDESREVTSAKKFLAALDSLDGLAAAEEIVSVVAGVDEDEGDYDVYNQLADELDILDNDPRVTWAWIGECWFAVGGLAPGSEDDRTKTLRAFASLAQSLPAHAGTKQLSNAVKGTPLSHLSTMRLAQLWELVAHLVDDSDDSQVPGDVCPADASTLPVSVRPVAAPSDVRPVARTVLTRPAVMVPTEKSKEQVPRPSPPSTRLPTGSAAVGRKWRVWLDCEGFRTLAVCDPVSGETHITKGDLEGRRFTDPSAAASAVIDRYDPGSSQGVDGWTLWTLHDGSGRSIGSMRGASSAGRVEAVSTPKPATRTVSSAEQLSTSDRGVLWFLQMVRTRGAECGRLDSSRRTAVWISTKSGRRFIVRVKTRTAGTWQAQKSDEDLTLDDTGSRFWAFVDLAGAEPAVFILHSTEVAAGIRKVTDDWVAHDRRRDRTGHHAIELSRVAHGQSRWDLLGFRK